MSQTQLLDVKSADSSFVSSSILEATNALSRLVWANKYFFHLLQEITLNLIFIVTERRKPYLSSTLCKEDLFVSQ